MPSQNNSIISSNLSSQFVKPSRHRLFITLAGLAVATTLTAGMASAGAFSGSTPSAAPAQILVPAISSVSIPVSSSSPIGLTDPVEAQPADAAAENEGSVSSTTDPVAGSDVSEAPADVAAAAVAVEPLTPVEADASVSEPSDLTVAATGQTDSALEDVSPAATPAPLAPVQAAPVTPAQSAPVTPAQSAPVAPARPALVAPALPAPDATAPQLPTTIDPLDLLTAAQQIAEESLLTAKGNQSSAHVRLSQALADQEAARVSVLQAEADLTLASAGWSLQYSRYQQRLTNYANELAAAQGVLDAAKINLAAANANLTTINSNIRVIEQQLGQVRTQIDNAPTVESFDWSTLSTAEIEAIAEAMLIEKINTYRVNAGVAALPVTDRYNREAQYWSDTMAADNYMRHDTWAKYDNENIAQIYVGNDDPEAAASYMANRIFDLWKASPTHNAGMLRGTPNALGIGIHYDTATDQAWATLRGYVTRVNPADAWLPADAESSYGVTGLEANTEYTGTDVRRQQNTPVSAPTKAAVEMDTITELADPEQFAALEARAAELTDDLAAASSERTDAVQDVAAKRAEVTAAAAEVDTAQLLVDGQYAPKRAEVEAAEQAQTDALGAQTTADAAVVQAEAQLSAADQAVTDAQASYDQAVQDVTDYVASQTPIVENDILVVADPVVETSPMVESESQPEADAEEQPQAVEVL